MNDFDANNSIQDPNYRLLKKIVILSETIYQKQDKKQKTVTKKLSGGFKIMKTVKD